MKKKIWKSSLGLLVTAIASGTMPIGSYSASSPPCRPSVAKIVSVQGIVEVRRSGQTQLQPARLNDEFCMGDVIQVGERSRADVALARQPVLRLDQDTTIIVGGIRDDTTSLIDMMRGALYFFSRQPRNLEVRTPFVNAGVEGTEGLIAVESNRTLISIFDGTVRAENAFGSLSVIGGRSAVAEQGRAPVLVTVVRPRDAVQWAIYYVPTLYYRASDFSPGVDWQEMVRKSIDAVLRGNFTAAFEAIRNVPASLNDARFFTYRASLLLAVGRIDEARRDLDRALVLRSNDSDALALQAIVAVVQNDKDTALELAKRSVTTDPKSSSALIALSYAQQANFNLEGALSSLQQAVQLNPENALAWARLAELWLSFSQLDEALEAAQKAVTNDPNLSRTQTMLGFAYLTRVNTVEAKQAFERAIELDQADGLPRLGLGLAKIREGDLMEGQRELDIAVSLDPDNALFRSYLGKAYYEEKADKQAADQYEMSKTLDPKDPTSYFYDAILKQTENRPVDALQEMEKAIELNDNRAVYRSRLLLDSDLAARSASFGRIYSDLGFQQLALVEGWKSVNTDPTNFSAHRLLADSYSTLPRHEIARVSELLQSQLLQPLNTAPIQPRLYATAIQAPLGGSNLFLIGAGGPAALSFNEFNPLFNSNGVNFQTTSLAGENETYSGEGVLSGIYKNTSFSLGGLHFQTDGFRKNVGQRDSIGNAFLQTELSPSTSIQAEYRYQRLRYGDNRLRFFPDDFFPGEVNTEEHETVRVGLRHAVAYNSTFLGSFIFQNSNFNQRDNQLQPFFTFLNFKIPQNLFQSEGQHLFRSQYINIVSGLGYAKINGRFFTTLGQPLPPPDDIFVFPGQSTDQKHFNLYAYSDLNLIKALTLKLGASGDFVDSASGTFKPKYQFNPKFGFIWNPIVETTIRGAAFRVLKRTLITNQTLEPTQVAGFNQFFDDDNGTDSWRYGVGLDQKFTRQIYGGLEVSGRFLKIPFLKLNNDGSLSPDNENARENLSRTYLFWTPHPWIAVRAEYSFERFTSQGMSDLPSRLSTHRVPLGLSLFHPSGLSVRLQSTYYHQAGKFNLVVEGLTRTGSDDFWTLDLAVNFRFPKRYGFLTFGATNLLNKKFKYFDTDLRNPRIQPTRMIYGGITVALP
jgi:tetratricopeptide (TPR) repeat protein